MAEWDVELHTFLSRLREGRPPGSRLDCQDGASLYYGCLGRAYAAMHAAWALQRVIDAAMMQTTTASVTFADSNDNDLEMLRAWKSEMLDLAGQYLSGSTRAKMCRDAQNKPSFLGGSIVGRNMITALLESEKLLCDERNETSELIIDQALREIIGFEGLVLEECETVHGLVNGSSGWLHALLFIRAAVVGGKKLVSIELIEKTALHIITQGHRYARGNAEIKRIPLQFKSHDNLDLGAAHGMCGIIVVLLDAMDAMRDVGASIFEDSLRRIDVAVRLTVTYILELRNLRSSAGEGGKIIQWCNGVVGLGLMLVRCAETLGDHFNPLGSAGSASSSSRFLDRSAFLVEADMAATVVQKRMQQNTDTNSWKGPGLCHGASGCAYLFLQLWNLTGHQQYLDEAHAIASMLLSWPDSDLYSNDRPYSLFEGVAGALCLVADLRAAATRRSFFPGFGLPRKRQAFSPIPIPVPLKK